MTEAHPAQAGDVAAMAKTLYERGWMPATAGNISVRTGPTGDQALITGSGYSKGELTDRDLVYVRVCDSQVVHENRVRPSAETTIHTALYRATGCGAVVHVHSPYATTVSAWYGRREEITTVPFKDYELIKGFGLTDPSGTEVPVFPNWTQVPRIGVEVERYLRRRPSAPPVLLIAAHGATAWGDSLAHARDRMECLEALCQLVTLTGRPRVWTRGTNVRRRRQNK
jgi:methylthioribose-1-phosphate isomerase